MSVLDNQTKVNATTSYFGSGTSPNLDLSTLQLVAGNTSTVLETYPGVGRLQMFDGGTFIGGVRIDSTLQGIVLEVGSGSNELVLANDIVYAPQLSTGQGLFSSINSLEIYAPAISTQQLDIDGQVLTANPTELLLNGVPVATQSSLSTIADWSLDPAISSVNMSSFDLLSTTRGFFSTVLTDEISTAAIVAASGVFDDISTTTLTVFSTVHVLSTISSSVLEAETANFSTLWGQPSSFYFSTSASLSTVNADLASVSSLSVSSLNGGVAYTTANPPPFYTLPMDVAFSTVYVNGSVSPGIISFCNIGGSMCNSGIFYTGGTSNGYSINGSNYFGNPTTIGDSNLYNANLVVNGGATLDGGTLHGTTIGCLPVLGVNTVRLDVLPVGIDAVCPTFITLNCAGAGNFAAGGALSLAGGAYVEINTGEIQCINTTSGQSWLSVNNIQGNLHNGGDSTLQIHDVTKFEGSNIQMLDISSINGLPISSFINPSTVSSFQDLGTDILRVSTINMEGTGDILWDSGPSIYEAGSQRLFLTTGGATSIDLQPGEIDFNEGGVGGTMTFRDNTLEVSAISTLGIDSQSALISSITISSINSKPWPLPAASFYSLSTQVVAANTPLPLWMEVPGVSLGGISLSTNAIVVSTSGTYEIQTSIQLDKAGGGTSECDFWFRKNGTDIPDSAYQITVQGTTGETLANVIIFETMAAGDKLEVVIASADNTMAATFFQSTVTTPYTRPAIPSIITNIKLLG